MKALECAKWIISTPPHDLTHLMSTNEAARYSRGLREEVAHQSYARYPHTVVFQR